MEIKLGGEKLIEDALRLVSARAPINSYGLKKITKGLIFSNKKARKGARLGADGGAE